MGKTTINYDTAGMSNAYFLRLDDDGSGSEECRWVADEGSDPAKCRRHVLTIKSDIEQKVFWSAQQWAERSYPN